jgi:hypothetical protein
MRISNGFRGTKVAGGGTFIVNYDAHRFPEQYVAQLIIFGNVGRSCDV